MAKLTPIRLTVEGFRAFVDRQSTQIFPKHGLMGIRGKNQDTGGSSGSGKSSVVYALAYVLGLLRAPYTATKLKSKWTKTPLQVELEAECDGVPVLLKRGKVTSIKVGDEPEITGSVEAVDARLERLIGLSTELLRALTFRPQKKPGLFLSMKDSQKKDFLGGLLGAEELEKEIELAIPKANKLKEEAERAGLIVDSLRKNLRDPLPKKCTDESYLLEILAEAMNEVSGFIPRLAEANKKLDAAEKRKKERREALYKEQAQKREDFEKEKKVKRNALPARPTILESETAKSLKEAAGECEKRIRALESELKAKEKAARDAVKECEKQIQIKELLIRDGVKASKEKDKLLEQIVSATAAKCPTCEQPWTTAKDRIEEWRLQILDWHQFVANADQAKVEVEALKAKLLELKAAVEVDLHDDTLTKLREVHSDLLQKRTAELATAQVELREYDNRKKALEDQLALEEKVFSGDLSAASAVLVKDLESKVADECEKVQELHYLKKDAETKVDKAQSALALVKQENKAEESRFNREQAQYLDLKKQIDEQQKIFDIKTKAFAEESDFAAGLRAFLGGLFDEVLAEISSEANDILRSLRNVATTTVTFVSDKVTEKGAVKQQIRPVIIKNGIEMDFEVELSGGQGTSVELAVDLALARVIGRRTGHHPGFMILDEAFEGMDLAVKETCLEVLQKAAQDQLIFIVDHASELRDAFTGFLDVESSNEISRIVS
jgi:DNA repair exonuclease SbcCD ATPase subunit